MMEITSGVLIVMISIAVIITILHFLGYVSMRMMWIAVCMFGIGPLICGYVLLDWFNFSKMS